MNCSPKIKDDSYEFFENIDNYRNYEENIESTTTDGNITQCCTSFMGGWNNLMNTEKAKNICENFFKLHKKLPNVNEFNVKDWGFLNYWLNLKLSQVNNNICVKEFYDDMETHCTYNIHVLLRKELMYNVKNDELNKMKLLYGLYENYKKLDNILNDGQENNQNLLLEHSNKCCSDYIYANYFCKDEKNKFCIQLEKFRTIYEKLYSKLNGKSAEYSNNFIKLTQCDNNTLSTALIGTTVGLVPLLVGLYKFTPLRQFINSKKGKLTEKYTNNDDEMRNIMLTDQGNEQISSHQGRYNIKYQTL